MKEVDESQDNIILDDNQQNRIHEYNNLTYRQELEEKLKDITGCLKTGRGLFTHNSRKYNNLQDSINDVIKQLEKHNGEEWLKDEDKKKLEEKIVIMKKHAQIYNDLRLQNGVENLSDEDKLKIRYDAAKSILDIENKIPDNPGPEYGLIAPDKLEPGDVRETSWPLKWKQNVRYLGKKQIYTYEKNLRNLEHTDELTTDEFNALMDFMDPDNILSYKNDSDLCQKYPSMRIMMEKAIRANEKIQNMTEDEIAAFMFEWSDSVLNKSIASAKKTAERKGRTFTDKDRKNLEEKLEVLISDKMKKFGSKEDLTKKGDELEQVARFLDLKMKVISNKSYVKLPHTNTLGRIYSVSDYDSLIKHAKNNNDKEFYKNLRDIRELEDAGIMHRKPGFEKTYYKDIDETLHKTVKKELFGFRIGKAGYRGLTVANDAYEANDTTTFHTTRYSKDIKGRVGKIGLKLHSKHKSVSLSGGIAFGQVKQSTSIGSSIVSLGGDAMMTAEASAIRARVKFKAGKGPVSGSVGANASVGYAFGILKGGIGNITVKDDDGKEHEAYGLAGNAGFVLAAVKGGGSASISIFGIRIGASYTTYLGGIGAGVGGELQTGGAKFSLAGALGIGAGLSFSINWTEAVTNVKRLWRKSKLKKLIADYKEKKKLKNINKDDSLEIKEQKNKDIIDPEIANPEKGKGSADKKHIIKRSNSSKTINRNTNKNNDVNKSNNNDNTNLKRSNTVGKNNLPRL